MKNTLTFSMALFCLSTFVVKPGHASWITVVDDDFSYSTPTELENVWGAPILGGDAAVPNGFTYSLTNPGNPSSGLRGDALLDSTTSNYALANFKRTLSPSQVVSGDFIASMQYSWSGGNQTAITGLMFGVRTGTGSRLIGGGGGADTHAGGSPPVPFGQIGGLGSEIATGTGSGLFLRADGFLSSTGNTPAGVAVSTGALLNTGGRVLGSTSTTNSVYPDAGTATITVKRIGNQISLEWVGPDAITPANDAANRFGPMVYTVADPNSPVDGYLLGPVTGLDIEFQSFLLSNQGFLTNLTVEHVSLSAVPEPSSMALILIGCAGFACRFFSRRRSALIVPFLTLAVCGLGPHSEAKADHLQVYLLGGQSNMDGRAPQASLPTELRNPQDDVLLYARVGTPTIGGQLVGSQPASNTMTNGFRDFGPEVLFGRVLADSLPDQNIALIKHAVGATNLAVHWNPTTGATYAAFRQTVDNGLQALTTAGHTYDIAGMLWMQGEQDTLLDDQTNNYAANLTAFIADVRGRYGNDLPFLIGQLSVNQTSLNATRLNTIRQAQANVAASVPNTALIVTDGFGIALDNVHFTAAGQMGLGTAFALSAQTFAVPEPGLSAYCATCLAFLLVRTSRIRFLE